MRAVISALALVVLTTVPAACGGSGGKGSGGTPKPSSLLVQLQEQNFSGEDGTATLTAENGKTRVVVDMASVAGSAQPAHIGKGTCSSSASTPVYPLHDIVHGTSTTLVNASLESLKQGYVIDVNRSSEKIHHGVACGDIAPNAKPIPTFSSSG